MQRPSADRDPQNKPSDRQGALLKLVRALARSAARAELEGEHSPKTDRSS
jgi:hypothetical protein